MERIHSQSHIMSFVRLKNVYTPLYATFKNSGSPNTHFYHDRDNPALANTHILQSRIENMIHKRTTINGTDLFIILLWRLCELPLYLVYIYITMGILVKTLDYKVRWEMYINRHLYTFYGNQRLITITTP